MKNDDVPIKPTLGEVICRCCGRHGLHWLGGLHELCDASGKPHVCAPLSSGTTGGRRHDDQN